MRPLIALVSLIALAGCGEQVERPTPDFVVGGVGVKLDSDAMLWAGADDFPARFERTADAAARYFGGTYSSLASWVVVFTDDASRCPGASACAYRDLSVIYVTRHHNRIDGPPAGCVEASQLVHEIGHAILDQGDHCHQDALWSDFVPVAMELESLEPMRDDGLPCWPTASLFDWRSAPGC